MIDQIETGNHFRKEVKSQLLKASAAGVVGGLLAASLAAWGVVKQWPGLLGLVPAGAVMAFPTACESNSGWADFKPATGRMIIGAGTAYDQKYISWKQVQLDGVTTTEIHLTPYPILTHAGEEAHILNVREIPSHRHSISTRPPGGDIHDGLAGSQEHYGIDQVYDPAAPTTRGFGPLHQVIAPTGGNGGHNTMPPYLALYWCQKS